MIKKEILIFLFILSIGFWAKPLINNKTFSIMKELKKAVAGNNQIAKEK